MASGESLLFENEKWVIEEGKLQRFIRQRFQTYPLPSLVTGKSRRSSLIGITGEKSFSEAGTAAWSRDARGPPQTIILHLVALTYARRLRQRRRSSRAMVEEVVTRRRSTANNSLTQKTIAHKVWLARINYIYWLDVRSFMSRHKKEEFDKLQNTLSLVSSVRKVLLGLTIYNSRVK